MGQKNIRPASRPPTAINAHNSTSGSKAWEMELIDKATDRNTASTSANSSNKAQG